MSNVAKEKNNAPAGGRSLRNANRHILFKGLTIGKSLMRKAKDSLKRCTFSNWIKRKKKHPESLEKSLYREYASIINLYLYICFHFMKVHFSESGKEGQLLGEQFRFGIREISTLLKIGSAVSVKTADLANPKNENYGLED